MAEEIVACTGCGKKFKIPAGADPSGSFPCTACSKPVQWGVVAPSVGGRRKPSGGRGSARAAASSAPPARGGKDAGRQERGRRGARERDDGQKANNTAPLLIAIGAGVLLVGFFIVMYANSKKPAQAPETATSHPSSPSGSTGGLSSDGLSSIPQPSTSTDTSSTPAATAPVTTTPVAPPPPDDNGIGAVTKDDDPKPTHPSPRDIEYWSEEKLFARIDSTSDTTEAERAQFDALVKDLTDFNSGRAGVLAQSKLTDVGRKAVPSLLSSFAGQTWESDEEQFAAFKVQQVLHAIVRADKPRKGDFIARFNPREKEPPSNFKLAARTWIAHWLGDLQFKETFKDYEDSEKGED